MKAGEFVHVIADAHIYDRHVPMIEELISREPLPAPKFWLNPEVKDFYDFTPDDVKLFRHEVLGHRITLNYAAIADGIEEEKIVDAIVGAVQTP